MIPPNQNRAYSRNQQLLQESSSQPSPQPEPQPLSQQHNHERPQYSSNDPHYPKPQNSPQQPTLQQTQYPLHDSEHLTLQPLPKSTAQQANPQQTQYPLHDSEHLTLQPSTHLTPQQPNSQRSQYSLHDPRYPSPQTLPKPIPQQQLNPQQAQHSLHDPRCSATQPPTQQLNSERSQDSLHYSRYPSPQPLPKSTPQQANPQQPQYSLPDLPQLVFYNIVARFDTKCELDLSRIVRKCIYVEFDTKCELDLNRIVRKCIDLEFRQGGSRMKMGIRNPEGTAVIYKSGKIMCYGTTNVDDSYKLARKVARCLQKSGVKIDRLIDYRIVNAFSSVTMPFRINMFKLRKAYEEKEFPESTSHISYFSYEPEIHTGVDIKLKDLGVTMKGFASGRVTVFGSSINEIQKAFEIIYPLFKLCKSST